MEATGTKISELSELSSITGQEYIPIQDSSGNKKLKIDKLAKKEDLSNKQDILISGTNIKTVNNQTIVGEGNINAGITDVPNDGTKYVRQNGKWVTETPIPTNISEFENDSNYITSADIQNLATKDEVNKKQNALISGENIKSINGESVVGSGNVVINPTIMDLKWTTNVATTRKLVPTELRAKDVRIAYTNNGGVYIAEKYTAEAIDDTSWADNANWKGCRTPMTPLFENAGAKFNDDTGYYEMNELTDLTEDDCIKMYAYYKPNAIMTSYSGMWQFLSIRTNFPIPNPDTPYDWISAYRECPNLEIAKPSRQSPLLVGNFNVALLNCNKLRKVLTIIACFNNRTNINFNLPLLEYYKIRAIQANVILISPKINYESVRYWIDKAKNTSAITITVHPTTYGYLTGTIEPTEQVGGTKEEWMQIVTDAAEKQISFATE